MSDIDTDAVFAAPASGAGQGARRWRVWLWRALDYEAVGKRVLDLVLVLVLLPVALPLVVILWSLARMEGGAGFYGHVRVGRQGQTFTCWKIRTMRPEAERLLAACLAADPTLAAEWTESRKLRRDPRITTLGRVLRSTSLDELPQIWNVLCGQMSFVGPRPVTADEIARYGTHARFYLQCRPGLTGLWQVSGRNDTSYDQRIIMDRRYAETIGLGADLKLILRTVPAVLRRTGR